MSLPIEISCSRDQGGFFHFTWDPSKKANDSQEVVFSIISDDSTTGLGYTIHVPEYWNSLWIEGRHKIETSSLISGLARRIQQLNPIQYDQFLRANRRAEISFVDLRELITGIEFRLDVH